MREATDFTWMAEPEIKTPEIFQQLLVTFLHLEISPFFPLMASAANNICVGKIKQFLWDVDLQTPILRGGGFSLEIAYQESPVSTICLS